jgi:hypothetical protein
MYGLITQAHGRSWHAYLPLCEEGHLEIAQINIERVSWSAGLTYYYVSRGTAYVGVWPGTESDEWIEYIPPPARQNSAIG